MPYQDLVRGYEVQEGEYDVITDEDLAKANERKTAGRPVEAQGAAPYGVRPVPGAWVSMPLRWSEVRPGLDPSRFNLRTARARLDEVGDLWKPSLGAGADLLRALERLPRLG